MRIDHLTCFGVVAMALASPIQASPIPQGVADMIKAASDSGDAVALKTTIGLAKKTHPDSTPEIDALVADLTKTAAEERIAKLESQTFFEGWTGQGQAGASNSTGNTVGRSTSLGLRFEKDGIQWRNKILGTEDYTREDGVTSQNRAFASYQADYKVTDRLYGFGLGSYERDQFAGFDRRFSEALGAGYTIYKSPAASLNLEAGPAYRQTRYITGESTSKVGLRVAAKYAWAIMSDVQFTEDAVYYAQSGDSTLTSTTALTAKLLGALSVQASLLYNHEQRPPPGLAKTDTTTRLMLVYGF